MMKPVQEIRPSPIAGQWYPANASRLAAQVDEYLNSVQLPPIAGEIIAVMAPHAGHRYSGPVAGYAFATVRELQVDLVAVIAPMHYPVEASLLTTAHSAYATPLGQIPVDQIALNALDDQLRSRLGYGFTYVAQDPEHSLEIELPFLQRALSREFKLLPVMVRDHRESVVRALGEGLAFVLSNPEILGGRRALIVASTDLSHFYPQALAEELDQEILRQVQAVDPAGILRAEKEGKGFACGHGALAAVLWAARGLGAEHAQILHYGTSGDVTGERDQVVGYGAAVITRIKK